MGNRDTVLATAMRVLLCVTAVVVAQSGLAYAEGGAEWRYAPALAPSPPAGVAPAVYPVPLGTVGQISFWAPNRGLLITGGTAPSGSVAPGLYAYDGVSWHQLSTVCGGARGRIAWAGPDEFWTIADQRAGQIKATQQGTLSSLSLCHFLNGEVVGSYAMPLEKTDSYLEMDAAGCLGPADCWFAGKDGNGGSFHLHWNGSEVETVYDPEDHAVTGMANFQGRLYEGLAIGLEDSYLAGEDQSHPAVIRTIAPAGQGPLCNGAPSVFCDVFVFSGQPLPVYPSGLSADALSGFEIATDGSPLGVGATQLWAAADPRNPGSGASHAPVTILHQVQGGWAQVGLPPGEGLPEGAYLSGSETDVFTSQQAPVGGSIAPEPGTQSAWLSLGGAGSMATVALLEAPRGSGEGQGRVLETDRLPGPADPIGNRGTAGPIGCPALHECWMATSEGWLFHLRNEATVLEPDTDPVFDGAFVIATRPPDGGIPVIPPDAPPVDDSLANQQPPSPPSGPPQQTPEPQVKRKRRKPLVAHVKSRFLHGRVLVISFTLTGRAHVQLVGRRKSKVVAKTANESLRPGRHQLSLSLDPAHWPTKLQFKATPIGAPPSLGGSGGESSAPGANNTVTTG